MCVRNQIGNKVKEVAKYDSSYMIPAMDCVGKPIRKAYHWVPIEQNCYLVMDNAGGHGSDVTIKEYCANICDQINIKIFPNTTVSIY